MYIKKPNAMGSQSICLGIQFDDMFKSLEEKKTNVLIGQ